MNKTILKNLFSLSRASLVVAVTCSALLADKPADPPGQSHASDFKSQPLAPIATPTVTVTTSAATNLITPRAMKLLVLAADGNEAGFPALKSFLDQIGIPYDAVVTATQGLPALVGTNGNGNYQGIILTSGNLSYCPAGGLCVSGLDSTGWAALDAYTLNFGVRTVSYYTADNCLLYAPPQPCRYGLGINSWSAIDTTSLPTAVAFATAASTYFPYLNQKNTVTVSKAYLYPSTAVQATGEVTTPLLTFNNASAANPVSPVAVYHKDASGREYIALAFDNNPYLTHSMALNYGLFNWVTKGQFLGARKVYLSPQFDDLFISDILYQSSACPQGTFQTDPTVTDPTGCKVLRLTGADLAKVATWQSNLNKDVQAQQIKLSFPFNGIGTTATDNNGDPTLASAAKTYANTFFWLSHTWDHANLDCYTYVDNGGVPTCVAATYAQSAAEITQNNKLATSMKLNYDSTSMVTPNVSALPSPTFPTGNPAFLQAAAANKIQYLVCDGAAAACNPTSIAYPYLPLLPPNTGVVNSNQPSILEIPRHATNIFYNASTEISNDGSETDEYNYFYFATFGTQTWSDIKNREADAILGFMLRYDAAPLMFHQTNLAWNVAGGKSLFTDLTEDVFSKFKALSNLPVISLSQTAIGQLMRDRMAYNASGVVGVLTPGLNIALKTTGAAKIPVTGVCQKSSCQVYGGQNISTITLSAGGTTTIQLK